MCDYLTSVYNSHNIYILIYTVDNYVHMHITYAIPCQHRQPPVSHKWTNLPLVTRTWFLVYDK